MYQLYRDRPLFVLGIVLANIAITAWCLTLNSVLNNDAVTYLSIAQFILDGQWQSAFDYYSWPYYSVFIAMTAKLFFLDVETATYLLNTVLAISLSLAFVCIVTELSHNNQRIVLISMLVILLFPSLTKYRAFIIRDFGYLSCYLWSLYFIFRFCSTLNKKHLVGWLAFAGLSCLFRFEGIVFLLIAPYFLIVFTATRIPHRRAVLVGLSSFIVIASVLLTVWYLNDKYAALIEIAQNTGHDIHNIFDLFLANTQQNLGDEELGILSYAKLVLGSIGNIAYELIRRLAVFYFLLAMYAYYTKLGFDNNTSKRVWLVYVITNIGMLAVFSVYNNFLASRYTMALVLTLLILAPFTIDRLWSSLATTTRLKRIGTLTLFAILGFISLKGLDVRTEKQYLKEAGEWVKNELPRDARIYSNDRRIIYYADLGAEKNLSDDFSTTQLHVHIESKHIHNFDYIALKVTPEDYLEDLARQTLFFIYGYPHATLDGPDGRHVFIIKIHED